MFDPTPFEIVEAKGGVPLKPKKWGELSTVTISYGHGLSTSPMHLAAGYARLPMAGITSARPSCARTVRNTGLVSCRRNKRLQQAQKMLRKVVTDGTASFAEVQGL